MGEIIQLSEALLSEDGSSKAAVYPITVSQAVYDTNEKKYLDEVIKTLKAQQLTFGGAIDVTDNNVFTQIYAELTTDDSKAFFICSNSSGSVSGGHAVCTTVLAQVLHPSDSRGVAVNLGDVLLVSRLNGTYYFKLLPVNEAKKPSDASNVGTYGLMVPNDKEKLDKAVDDIDKTVFRTYQGEYNMNYCGWYGYYQYCTLGRPAGSVTGENYVLRVANGGKDGDYIVLEQTAYSCSDPTRVFRRIVKTKDRSKMDADGNTVWGDWKQIGENGMLTVYYGTDITSEQIQHNKEVYDALEEKTDGVVVNVVYIGKDAGSATCYLGIANTTKGSTETYRLKTNYIEYLSDSPSITQYEIDLYSDGHISESGPIRSINLATTEKSGFMSKGQVTALEQATSDITEQSKQIESCESDIADIQNTMYKDNYSMSLSPTLFEKGVATTVTGTITANRSLSWNTGSVSEKYTASDLVVKSGSTTITPASSGVNSNGYSYFTTSVSDSTSYNVSCTLNNQSKSFSGSVTAVYPKYYGSNTTTEMDSAKILALTKQGLSTTAAGEKIKVSVTQGEYLWLCVPSGMTISLVKDANTNIEVSMLSYTPTVVAVSGKGNYNCYRSEKTMNNTETLTLNITA